MKMTTAIGRFAILALAMASSEAWAEAAGQVAHLGGTLLVQRSDGAKQNLLQGSEVSPGDTLSTLDKSYAQIYFTDGSSMTLLAQTQVRIEAYQFVQYPREDDRIDLHLFKGTIRTVTGLIGRSNPEAEAYTIRTSAVVLKGRGSAETTECSQGCNGSLARFRDLGKGVYHYTFVGRRMMQNDAGTQVVDEGQAGFARDRTTIPVVFSVKLPSSRCPGEGSDPSGPSISSWEPAPICDRRW